MNNDERVTEAIEGALNLFVYAPIAFVLDTKPIGPDIATRGRAQAANARAIGEFTVKAGIKKLEAAIAERQGDQTATGEPVPPMKRATSVDATAVDDVEANETNDLDATVITPEGESGSAASGLALDDYDTLAASQIVKRLATLTAPELEAVRLHESNGRGRRTILNKISQLQK